MNARPLVVLDPGHGGDRPAGGSSPNNARGPNGLLEKDVALDVARRVARLAGGYAEVRLTRTEDVNLPLAERARLARDGAAVLFVSLHLNGAADARADGAEAWIARAAGPRSRALAAALSRGLAAACGIADRGVRERDLGVLLASRHAPGTAACLVEMAFLSNPERAHRLAEESHRQTVAAAIAEALRDQIATETPAAAHALGCREDEHGFSLGYVSAFGGRPTHDQVIQALDRATGTSYGNYEGYVRTLVDGTFFGRTVQGLHPSFYAKLQAAEQAAGTAMGSGANPGIGSVGGLRRTTLSRHGWGLAIDIDAARNPYILHEAGESELDRELQEVYQHIARLFLGRDSVIPRGITTGARSAARTAQLYTQLADESEAMQGYFRILSDPAAVQQALQRDADGQQIFGLGGRPTADQLLDLVMRDYVILAGRPGPAVSGHAYPALSQLSRARGDRPFAGNPSVRAPERGFLTIRREIVLALAGQGLRWGAIDLGGESGDIMHFDDGGSPLDRQIRQAITDASR